MLILFNLETVATFSQMAQQGVYCMWNHTTRKTFNVLIEAEYQWTELIRRLSFLCFGGLENQLSSELICKIQDNIWNGISSTKPWKPLILGSEAEIVGRVVKMIWSSRRNVESRRHWGPEAPQRAGDLGAAQAPSGVQGQRPCWGPQGRSPQEQNGFEIFTLAEIASPQSIF